MSTYGGPAVSISKLALALARAGVSVALWAPDGSAVESELVIRPSWPEPISRCGKQGVETLDGFDVVHDNGIWLPHNHRLAALAAQHKIPRLVSLRGMLEPWAMSYKAWKKRLAWALYQRGDLENAQCHHATAEAEARNLRRYKLGVPVRVVPNGVDIPEHQLSTSDVTVRDPNEKRCNIALFLSRIHPKKGLPLLIKAWGRLRPNAWILHIAGPDEAGHRAEIEHLVCSARLGNVVKFLGRIDPGKKQSVYEAADLFILPTHSENFGIVVAEALAHGVPVLTTKGAPWPMLEEEGCGWWVDVSVDAIAEGLRRATSCDRETLAAMGERGRAFVAREYSWDKIAQQFIALYEEILRECPSSSA